VIVLVAAACSGTSSSPAVPIVTPASTPSNLPYPTMALAAGPFSPQVIGGGTYPTYTVVMPAGWFAIGTGFVAKYPETGKPRPVLGLSVWDVGRVFRDPCHSQGEGVDPGPGIANLVAALLAQTMRDATKPTDVSLAGYMGKYLEWSVPADLKSSSWTNFDACDLQSDGYHDFLSWLGAGGVGERYEQVPGQVDRLWILDVKGQRLVVDSTYSPDTSQVERDALEQIVESIQFAAK
jgi:hypothetical protein